MTVNLSMQVKKAIELLPEEYRAACKIALHKAGQNAPQLARAILALPVHQREGIGFLIANMPDCDLVSLPRHLLVENVRYAYKAHAEAPWADRIPHDVFLNDVLPYINLDEPRDDWRKMLYDRFHRVAWQHKSPGQAAKFLNHFIYNTLKFRYHPTRRPRPHMSPAECIKVHWASCSGLSITLVDTCRSVGIPAHVAGIPRWRPAPGQPPDTQTGNHNWLEVWDSGWHTLNAGGSNGFDDADLITRCAATDPNIWDHCIYAASYKRTGRHYPLAWDLDKHTVPGIDVTQAYIDRQRKLSVAK